MRDFADPGTQFVRPVTLAAVMVTIEDLYFMGTHFRECIVRKVTRQICTSDYAARIRDNHIMVH